MKIISFISQTLSGKSIYRTLFNGLVEEECRDLSGRVLDLASGANPSYERYLPKEMELVKADQTTSKPVDFNHELPFEDGEFDAVLLFNAIYIAENVEFTLKEVRRVLRVGGKLFIASPFISPEMPEPHDYRRLTSEGLSQVLELSGFTEFKIQRFGERFSSAVYLLHPVFLVSPIRLLANLLALFFDRLIPEKVIRLHPVPLGYFVTARK